MNITFLVIAGIVLLAVLAWTLRSMTERTDEEAIDTPAADGSGRKFVTNGFTPFMLDSYPLEATLDFVDSLPEGVISAVARQDIARVLKLEPGKLPDRLRPGDEVYVAVWDVAAVRYRFLKIKLKNE